MTTADTLLAEVAEAAKLSADANHQRDERVRRARRLGVSTRRIAAAAGISHTQVRRICA